MMRRKHEGNPLSQSAVEDKFKECFNIGVRPLSDAQYAGLKARVQDVHQVADMSRFFDEISFPL